MLVCVRDFDKTISPELKIWTAWKLEMPDVGTQSSPQTPQLCSTIPLCSAIMVFDIIREGVAAKLVRRSIIAIVWVDCQKCCMRETTIGGQNWLVEHFWMCPYIWIVWFHQQFETQIF